MAGCPDGRAGDGSAGGSRASKRGAMKFTVEHDAVVEAVTWAARALPARPVLPVLTGLLLSAGWDEGAGWDEETGPVADDDPNAGGFLTLSCFDYEVSARVRVRAEVAEP